MGFSVVVDRCGDGDAADEGSFWLARGAADRRAPLASRELVKRHQAELYRYAFAGEKVEYPWIFRVRHRSSGGFSRW